MSLTPNPANLTPWLSLNTVSEHVKDTWTRTWTSQDQPSTGTPSAASGRRYQLDSPITLFLDTWMSDRVHPGGSQIRQGCRCCWEASRGHIGLLVHIDYKCRNHPLEVSRAPKNKVVYTDDINYQRHVIPWRRKWQPPNWGHTNKMAKYDP